MVYRILSFDGGGVRGIYTAQLLSMLNQEVEFLKKVDLFVGTSTGSFIALGLVSHFSPEQLVEFYNQFAKVIFSIDKDYDALSELCPKYQTHVLKQLMEAHVFKENPFLSQLSKKVVIPAFKLYDKELLRWSPYYFHNLDESHGQSHRVIDVALASGAAPIYFPSYQGYIDGGVFANNPSMVGLSQALQYNPNLKVADVSLLSIGTGIQSLGIKEEVTWGAKGWLEASKSPSHPLFSLITEGMMDVAHEQCGQILKNRYQRLNTVIDNVAIDDSEKMLQLIEMAKAVPKKHPKLWEDTLTWLRSYF